MHTERVAIITAERPEYGPATVPEAAPELLSGQAASVALKGVRQLLHSLDLDTAHYGTPRWNPLGDLVQPGERILIKPNWVLHENQSGQGTDCLVTHSSVIAAMLEYALLARPAQIVVGDAPVQSCDFKVLMERCGIGPILEHYRQRGTPILLTDFRRTVMEQGEQRGEQRSADQFVLFDLADDSLLHEVDADAEKFRVTMYNPDLMRRTHAPGRHQYLIAREALEADLVINLPKLKCHKKSGITGALKNLVGINGNKEFLPHHRIGGSGSGGDCYEGSSPLKRVAETLMDQAWRGDEGTGRKLRLQAADLAARAAAAFGADRNLEGSWYGNDTVWRMALDLQRVLRYGTVAGRLERDPQRRVLHITDAIIGGEREGPLAPYPVASGFLTGALSAPAAEWVHALLMGFDPYKIPLVRQAFESFSYALTGFPPESIEVVRDGKRVEVSTLQAVMGRPFAPPEGWRGHCELEAARV